MPKPVASSYRFPFGFQQFVRPLAYSPFAPQAAVHHAKATTSSIRSPALWLPTTVSVLRSSCMGTVYAKAIWNAPLGYAA